MSRITLSGNASGTGNFTLASPNSNTDRTLTLPDATGTVNVSGLANEVPAGSAGAPAIYPTGDSNTGIFFPAADTIAFAEGGAEAMRINSSGVLILGKTTTSAMPGVIDARGYVGNAGTVGAAANTFNIFWTGSAAQLWIDSSNLGSIQLSSDYRIKRNVETQTVEALSRVMQLRPVTYQMADYGELFKATDEVKEGFIAHELAEVIPSAVEGEKDDPNQIQSLKLDALVAVLTKAIQEQQAIITALEARITALEAN
jgi:hypothetical protein